MERPINIEFEARLLHSKDRHLSWLRWEQLSQECQSAYMQDVRKNLGMKPAPLERIKLK